MELSYSELEKIISTRRSVRPTQFSGEPVSQYELMKCFEMANWAPTHGNTEPWRFIVFGGDSRFVLAKDHIAALLESQPDLPEAKQTKMQLMAEKSSFIIAVVVQLKTMSKIRDIEEYEAVSCAVQNFHLAAHSLGLAGFWSTGGCTFYPEAQSWLQLDDNQQLMGFFYVGKTDRSLPVISKGNVSEKIRWVK